ncbi:MAG TPA: Asp-tRNA(Asn)/Glu-tRNA(Gln) amidotransferase subunit GatA [Fimbriimonadaceae bacterium]
MLTHLSAAKLAAKIREKEVSTVEVAEAYLKAIADNDSKYKCYLTVDEESVLDQARAAEHKINSGEAGPLTGVPIAVKDNMSTRGLRTTAASKILDNYVPPYDASVILRLKAEGCVILGKTNLDEFAMGTSTEFSAYHPTNNPWDVTRSPGGSSGGSAAAVAAGLAPVALGSDTGGSIRQPAALCGVVGFKPTYGRVSRYGLIAFGSSLDQIGPLATTVEDAALLSQVISGHDPADSTSLEMAPIRVGHVRDGSIKGAKIALPKELFAETNDPGVMAAIHASIEKLKKEGAEFTEISLPSIEFGVTTYYIIAPAEASSNLARFDGVRYGVRTTGTGHIDVVERTRSEGFGHEVKARIMIGTYALSAGYYDAYYLKAQQVRALMQQEFNKAFQQYDFILSPTSPIPAFKLGELKQDPMALKLLDFCTIPANLGGMPAISLNCGFCEVDGTKLPVGLQLIGAPLQDEKLLQAAYVVEQILDATERPPGT